MSTESHTSADRYIEQLLDSLPVGRHRSQFADILGSVVRLAHDDAEALNVKIVAAALKEMVEAFEMFQPHLRRRKVTIFGSARTAKDDPLYAQARAVSAELATDGWMCITGAGPGIMEAAMEGAGRENSIGVSIRLPFEQGANPIIAGDDKYVSMKYFFTRKLMLVKESQGFICLPGGFGTLDELFELITLTQTGKGVPTPIVLLDVPGDPYWERLDSWIREELLARRLISAADTALYSITDSIHDAAAEVRRFYLNYHSMRFLGDRLILRMQRPPSDGQLALLNERFAGLIASGTIRRVEPSDPEKRERDQLQLARVGFHFTKHGYGDLRSLIDTINEW